MFLPLRGSARRLVRGLSGRASLAPLAAFASLACFAALTSGAVAEVPDASDTTPSKTTAHSPVDRATATANWPVSPENAERAFEAGDFEIVSERYAGRGLTGAQRLELDLADPPQRIQAKWKPMPRRLDGINNSPRKELAAYQAQKLFLEPENYVVPTSMVRCLEADAFTEPKDHHKETIFETRCELGVLSLWLENVTLPDKMLDTERFEHNPLYARYLADFNLATYLMKHQDGRRGNFMVSTDDAHRRVFAIDNGVAFSGMLFNWFVSNWKKIHVPALRRESIERLRRLTPADLQFLGVIVQLERSPDGSVESRPPTRNFDPEDGIRIEGPILQVGLDHDEIESLWERIEDLLEEVDSGEIGLF